MAIRVDDLHSARAHLLALKNTMQDKVLPLDYLVTVHVFTRARDLTLHLNGAHLYNAVVGPGVDTSETTRHLNSVSMCLPKGLGTPVNSMLCGSVELIDKTHR